jgi:hypothetical protein
MLSSRQMATKAPVTADQYLHRTFEYEAEFVRGAIVERIWPGSRHSWAEANLAANLHRLADGAMFAAPPQNNFPEHCFRNSASLAPPGYLLQLTPAALFSDL